MNSRQRVRAVLNRQATDRTPVDIWYTGEVLASLQHYTGLKNEADIWRRLGIDKIVWIGAPYLGRLRPLQGDATSVTPWGVLLKPVQAGPAQYLEHCYQPLADMQEIEELDRYPWWPDPDLFDYDDMVAQVERACGEFATIGPWVSFFEIYCWMRGLEQAMMDLIVAPEFVHAALDRIEAIQTRLLTRFLEQVRGKLDLVFISDDMGSQDSLLISIPLWQEFLGPRLKRWCQLIHGYGVKVFYHSDGSVDRLIPHLIEAGVDVLNPIQHACPGMDLEHVKAAYGDKLIFHGGVDNQYALPRGTAQEARAETEQCLKILGKGGGYICCSCQQ
jgi:uroporphyrinogen decarboxylase